MQGAPSAGEAWTTGDCGLRVLRGGSWFDGPRFLRAAYRYGYVSGYRIVNCGFRIARTLAPLSSYLFGGPGGKAPWRNFLVE